MLLVSGDTAAHNRPMAKLTKAVDAGAPTPGPPPTTWSARPTASRPSTSSRTSARSSSRASCVPAIGCRPSASWRCRSASAVRRSGPGCRRCRRWASSRRATAPARSSPTVRRRSRPGRSASWRRCTGSPRKRCSRRAACWRSAPSGLAAERATGEDLAAIAEEMAGMFASLDQPLTFLSTTSRSTAPSPTPRTTRSWPR